MRSKFIFFCILSIGLFAGNLTFAIKVSRKINVFERDLNYEFDENSLEGSLYFTINQLKNKVTYPYISTIVKMSSTGNVLLQKTFQHDFEIFGTNLFKPVSNNLNSYFLGSYSKKDCCKYSFHFIDNAGNTVFPYPFPIQNNLDGHSLGFGKTQTSFFIIKHDSPERKIIDFEIQEWDKTGNTHFNWHTKNHYNIFNTNTPIKNPDLNSIFIEENGNLLLSFRMNCELAEVEYKTGSIINRISYLNWKFENDEFNGFCFQHNASILSNGNLILFDNGNGNRPSRVVEYKLDKIKKIAKLVWEYRANKNDPYRRFGGSVQRLSNGNTLIAWGVSQEISKFKDYNYPIFSEVSSEGKIIKELSSTSPLWTADAYLYENKNN